MRKFFTEIKFDDLMILLLNCAVIENRNWFYELNYEMIEETVMRYYYIVTFACWEENEMIKSWSLFRCKIFASVVLVSFRIELQVTG